MKMRLENNNAGFFGLKFFVTVVVLENQWRLTVEQELNLMTITVTAVH
jgi:hypothetical protein